MSGNNLNQKKIAVFGTFDVDNYGDLLFPHIAEYRLRNYQLDFVSPTTYETLFNDAKSVITFENSRNKHYDGVLIGGGNILHLDDNSNTVYKDFSGFSYADLWVGAVKLAAKLQKPSLFNAPGISHHFRTKLHQEIARSVFSNSSYVAFREQYSTDIANDLFDKKNSNPSLKTTIDTAFDISAMWPCHLPRTKKVVFNLNPRYHKPISETVDLINQISKSLNCEIRFVIIGDCHGDGDFTRKVADLIGNDCTIAQTDTLKDLAFEIATAEYFIGSSMHGFITALSYGTPAFLVLDNKPIHKFQGLYNNCQLSQISLCESFEDCIKNIEHPSVLKEENWQIIRQKLNKHWEEVEKIIEQGIVTKVDQNVYEYRKLLNKDLKAQKSLRKKVLRKLKNEIKRYIG